MLPLSARMNLGAIKGYSAFPKATALLEPHQIVFRSYSEHLFFGGGSYSSAEVQSEFYSPSQLGNQERNS